MLKWIKARYELWQLRRLQRLVERERALVNVQRGMAVALMSLYSGKPVVGTIKEDGSFHIEILEDK